jgi:hypothetical protein
MIDKSAEIFWGQRLVFEVRCSASGRKNEEVGTKKIKFLVSIYSVHILKFIFVKTQPLAFRPKKINYLPTLRHFFRLMRCIELKNWLD